MRPAEPASYAGAKPIARRMHKAAPAGSALIWRGPDGGDLISSYGLNRFYAFLLSWYSATSFFVTSAGASS